MSRATGTFWTSQWKAVLHCSPTRGPPNGKNRKILGFGLGEGGFRMQGGVVIECTDMVVRWLPKN